MKRSNWISSLTETSCPPWTCAACTVGVLRLKDDSLVYEETVQSKRSHEDENFDFDWIKYVFSAWAVCDSRDCGQAYAISGTGGIEPRYINDEDWDYLPYFVPKSINPILGIIDIPPQCPDNIKLELYRSFDLFWANKAACAGRIRVALELLMDHAGVPRGRSEEKATPLSLHARIDAYSRSEPQLADNLMALKWLGNSAAHDGGVAQSELLDAFELLEHALSEMLSGRTKRMAELAKKLTEKHGRKRPMWQTIAEPGRD